MTQKVLLVISFGTSFLETSGKTISATENALARAFAGYDLRRAFTSKKVIKKLRDLHGIETDDVAQAMERIAAEGYGEVLAQPLHIINGTEYESLVAEIMPFKGKFSRLAIGRPLLTGQEDYTAVVNALRGELPVADPGEGVVLMGHGSRHHANAAYPALDYVFKDEGLSHVYVATVEGYPALDTVIKRLDAARIRKVTLMPFMLVAGEHAQNDMAGEDEGSWRSILERHGFAVEVRMLGLGEMEKIHQVYIDHAKTAIRGEAV